MTKPTVRRFTATPTIQEGLAAAIAEGRAAHGEIYVAVRVNPALVGTFDAGGLEVIPDGNIGLWYLDMERQAARVVQPSLF